MKRETPIVHIIAQESEHDEALIIGNRAGLEALHKTLSTALAKRSGQTNALAFCRDGEGYRLCVIMREKMNDVPMGYTDPGARDNTKWPDWLLDRVIEPPAPTRVQRKRAKGWRMPPGAVYVGRPGPLGNPFVPGVEVQISKYMKQTAGTVEGSVILYRQHIEHEIANNRSVRQKVEGLRGRTLVCWCRVGDPCHADVLLEIANRPLVCEAVDA